MAKRCGQMEGGKPGALPTTALDQSGQLTRRPFAGSRFSESAPGLVAITRPTPRIGDRREACWPDGAVFTVGHSAAIRYSITGTKPRASLPYRSMMDECKPWAACAIRVNSVTAIYADAFRDAREALIRTSRGGAPPSCAQRLYRGAADPVADGLNLRGLFIVEI